MKKKEKKRKKFIRKKRKRLLTFSSNDIIRFFVHNLEWRERLDVIRYFEFIVSLEFRYPVLHENFVNLLFETLSWVSSFYSFLSDLVTLDFYDISWTKFQKVLTDMLELEIRWEDYLAFNWDQDRLWWDF